MDKADYIDGLISSLAYGDHGMSPMPSEGWQSLKPPIRDRVRHIYDELYWDAFEIIKPALICRPFKIEQRMEYEDTDDFYDPWGRNTYLKIPIRRMYGGVLAFQMGNAFGSYTKKITKDGDVIGRSKIDDYMLAISFIERGMDKEQPGNKIKENVLNYFNFHSTHEEYAPLLNIMAKMVRYHFIRRDSIVDVICHSDNHEALVEILRFDDGTVFDAPNMYTL